MTFSQKMRGILEMHLFVQITRICKRVSTKKAIIFQQKQLFISIDSLRGLVLIRYLEGVQLWKFLS